MCSERTDQDLFELNDRGAGDTAQVRRTTNPARASDKENSLPDERRPVEEYILQTRICLPNSDEFQSHSPLEPDVSSVRIGADSSHPQADTEINEYAVEFLNDLRGENTAGNLGALRTLYKSAHQARKVRRTRSERVFPERSPAPFPWRVCVLSLLLLLMGFPWYAEHLTYALSRGRERAAAEVAKSELQQGHASELSNNSRMVAKAVRPCVVKVSAWRSYRENTRGVAAGPAPHDQGQGSGVIVAEEGFIVTNAHVVADSPESIEVQFSDGHTEAAQLVGLDEPTDIAVLKVSAGSFTPAPWGDSKSLSEGDIVWALGSPFGLDQSITFGIVSAKSRRGKAGTPHQDFLQTDAAVNPGNSGGPLVNSRGEIIGINTAISGEDYRGISFAVPSEIAQKVCQTIIRDGKVTRGWLGVKMARYRALGPKSQETTGVGVDGVFSGSPAELAGIRAGDHIISWGNQPVQCNEDLSYAVANSEVGDQIKLELVRDGEPLALAVTVGLLPGAAR